MDEPPNPSIPSPNTLMNGVDGVHGEIPGQELAWIHSAIRVDEANIKFFSFPSFLGDLLLENDACLARWLLSFDNSVLEYIPALTYIISNNPRQCVPFLQSLIREEINHTPVNDATNDLTDILPATMLCLHF